MCTWQTLTVPLPGSSSYWNAKSQPSSSRWYNEEECLWNDQNETRTDFSPSCWWNRSACPRVCVISILFACVNPTHLSVRSCTGAGTRLVRPPRLRSQSQSRTPLVPPTQTRCFVRSNTGKIAGWKVSTLTRRTSCTSAASSPTAQLD